MNKKSQFYMFTAIIFISFIMIIVSNKSTISLNNEQNLQSIHENYISEATTVMNNAVYNNQNITLVLKPFTEEFISYAKNKDIEIGILTLFIQNGKIVIVNYLNEPVIISGTGLLNPKEEISLDYIETVQLTYYNQSYSFKFSSAADTELKTLLAKEN